jgi:hypothetical protein
LSIGDLFDPELQPGPGASVSFIGDAAIRAVIPFRRMLF